MIHWGCYVFVVDAREVRLRTATSKSGGRGALAKIRKLRKQKVSILKIASQLGIGTSIVQRVVSAN